MDYIESKINDKVSARIYYSHAGKQIYLVDSSGNELAKIDLVNGVDFGHFLSIIKDGGDDNS